ncbi:CinA family protein [Ponticaulis sp.]|uniref:CinA family protein n=1 Tax=Ponticaulis sp. TaxID=2020902 RepID=UPI000B62A992|nr:CinA family protein [Ponticaulis sp.]MAI89409.1 damage-inducible protein CinA [Ponticaulis sp.]OUY00448.1 MAG: damage-inducible protein CinA [Hyphomonadaceae bacterium TMED5]
MFSGRLLNLARLVLDDAQQRRLRIVTAESCTGGLLSGLLVEIPGSSKVFERGFVTYSNKAKEEVLGVPGDLLADYGAVSEPVARAMAEGALEESRANISISITGVAGPGGGTRLKPVGTVHFALARENAPIRHRLENFGDIGRSEIRMASVAVALEMLQESIAG